MIFFQHDAGGPAVMDGMLIGVLSFSSKRCDQADQPAVFSTVGAVANWLDNLGEKKVQLRWGIGFISKISNFSLTAFPANYVLVSNTSATYYQCHFKYEYF